MWVRTDEAEDVAASARHALVCWNLQRRDPQAWKWFALALHSALQGACVCYLTTTSGVGALTPENTAKWLNYFEVSRTDAQARPPAAKLLSLPELLKAVRITDSVGSGAGLSVSISDAEYRRLKSFHDDIRNQFIHFAPQGWSIETSGSGEIATIACGIIQQIAEEGWAFRHKSAAWRSALLANLSRLSALT